MKHMLIALALAAGTLAVAKAQSPEVLPQNQTKYPYPAVRDQRGVIPTGPKVAPYPDPVLGDGPWDFETYEQRHIRVSVVTKGITGGWGMTWLPDVSMLITEKAGKLRILRPAREGTALDSNAMLDPTPISGIPAVHSQGTMAGLMDVQLHPRFAENRYIYISYHKPVGRALDVEGREQTSASNSILRGTWDGKALTDVRDIFVSGDVDTEVSRLTFDRDGLLYMSIGGPGTGPAASLDRPQQTNDYAGKILRMRDDGSVPPDNPFVGRPDHKPYIFTMGHRNQLGLAVNPFTGEIWSGEQGPNGGDEINILHAGKNYGWPVVSDGRDYRGPYISPSPFKEGMERPHVLFVPSIAISSIAFYTGERFPNWRRNLFVGGMREGEIARTGQVVRIVFNDNWEELRRESLLRDLHQRIRDVKQGPDGLLYVLTDEPNAAILKIEPLP
jgi:glucose/arabinose dehydrogenase